MENILVSARVPKAKKEMLQSALEEMGVTTSQLINAAIDYVLEHKELPTTKKRTRRDIRGFRDFVEQSTLKVDWSHYPEDLSYKDAYRQGKIADYESLCERDLTGM